MNFDQWRKDYDTMTYEEQVAYHNEIESQFPEQKHYNYLWAKRAMQLRPINKVLEFGIWKADLAAAAMADFYKGEWYGIEICQAAINKTNCPQVQYIFPTRFDWWNEARPVDPDIIIATHFIEHLSNDHFRQLVTYCAGVPVIHFEAPLTDKGNTWDGYFGTHKLEYGWNDINQLFEAEGYTLAINNTEAKTYLLQ